MTTKTFKTWQEAYSYCREANKPVIANVENETAKIYPSGSYKPIKYKEREVGK